MKIRIATIAVFTALTLAFHYLLGLSGFVSVLGASIVIIASFYAFLIED